jgi:UDP-N-acetyl-D-mannosaminuronic acid dehydrogenase
LNYASLRNRIRERTALITVLGLGHIGLPSALTFARAGFCVTGVDTDVHKVATLKQGQSSMDEPGIQELLQKCLKKGTFSVVADGFERIRTSDFVFICVPTPVHNRVPDLKHFRSAFRLVEKGAHKGLAIVIESTLPPLTTSEFVLPRIRRLGYAVDEELFVAYCPERLAPTRALSEFANNTRIVGGVGPHSGRIANDLFKLVCKDVRTTTAVTAELSKLAENTFRDLNIAYANLLALIAERSGADVKEIIDLANTHPRVRIHQPGIGVGGPCLPKDPLMLINNSPKEIGKLIRLERKINDEMPKHVITLLTQALASNGKALSRAKVGILGVTYKADVDDLTNTPTKVIIEELWKKGAVVTVYDPHSPETFQGKRASSIQEAVKDSDAVIITVPHKEFKRIDPVNLKKLTRDKCVIFDGPRILVPSEICTRGLIYLSLGNTTLKGVRS